MRMKISPPWIEEPEQQLVTKSILHLKPIQCVALGLPIMCLPSNQSTKSLCYEVVGDVMWYVVMVVVEQFKINLMFTGHWWSCWCVVVMTSSHCTSHTLLLLLNLSTAKHHSDWFYHWENWFLNISLMFIIAELNKIGENNK